MSVLDVLIDARMALLALTERVYLPGQPLPEDNAPIIVLSPVGEVDRVRYKSVSTLTRVQVSVWAADLDTALPLHQQARTVMREARFMPDGGGPLNDPETAQVGWYADYRR